MISEKTIMTQLKVIIYGSIVLLFCGLCLNAASNDKHAFPNTSSDIPCQNLDALNKVDDILHWEIQNDTLHIYTKKDSIRDEYERYKYIKSLENE